MMAGRMPPSFIPLRGIVVRNSQEMAPTPWTTTDPITRRIGATTTSAASVSRAKPNR